MNINYNKILTIINKQPISIKIMYFLLYTLFFCIPIINSHIFELFGINVGLFVHGNYEFTKVIFFNILTGIIGILFLYNLFKEKKLYIKIPKIIYFGLFIIIISTIFSDTFYTSLLGNSSKSHSAIMFINLILLFIIFINSKKKLLKNILLSTFISSFFVAIIGIKEFYFPSFEYGELTNRAVGTFGHPNYFTLYILILLPFLYGQKHNIFKYILLFLLVFSLFLTKSMWGIFIFIFYTIFKLKNKKIKILAFTILFVISFVLLYKFSFFTKLQSFLSRFFIWETTIKIIFSKIKILFLGAGLGNLKYIFDNFKSPYLYIFENIGFTADRPHNLLLNFFYHFGILSIIFLSYIFVQLLKIIKNTKIKNLIYIESISLFLLFTIFNFSGITQYLIIILVGAFLYKNNNTTKNNIYKINKILIIFITILSIFGIYFSTIYYKEEYKLYKSDNYTSKNYLYNKIQKEDYEKNIFYEGFNNLEDLCNKKINYTSSVENYFYCGNLLWYYNKELAIKYYNNGLEILPDLRDNNSKYYNNFIIKKFINTNRFFSEKYSNINEILKKIGKE